jgi:hypothetical protein
MDDAMAEGKTLDEMAEAAAAFPSTASGTWFNKPEAIKMAVASALRQAEEWCSKRDCRKGDCHGIDVNWKFIDETEYNTDDHPTILGGLSIFSVTIQIKEVLCVCRDIKPVILRPKGAPKRKVVMFKEQLRDDGLTEGQIARIDASKCDLIETVKRDEAGEAKMTTECAPIEDAPCPKTMTCTLVLYKIGDDADKGLVQKAPYDLNELPEGHYLTCECR